MPFDNTNFKEIPVKNAEEIAILDGMAYRLREPRLWCKWTLEVGESRCLVGALNEENRGNPYRKWRGDPADNVVEKLGALAPNLLTRAAGIVLFNNDPETTHADILNLIAHARESFEREQA